jgi:uncharacterized protein YkwD
MNDLRLRCQLASIAVLLACAARSVSADVLDSVNRVRAEGCDAQPGAALPLRHNARLDALASRLAQGADQRSAALGAGYRAASLLVISVTQVAASGDVAPILARQFCRQLLDPTLSEIGSWRRDSDVWLAIAAPLAPPAAADLEPIAARVLQLTNQARAQPRRCGTTSFSATTPLALSPVLAQVALTYARDMAAHDYMDHTGRDGSTPAQRITQAGYRWSEIGENLARGITTPERLVAGWLGSPEHCANLMQPAYREAGVAFADNPRSDAAPYWAMEFGTPR